MSEIDSDIIHDGEFQCDLCGLWFLLDDALRNHKKAYHYID